MIYMVEMAPIDLHRRVEWDAWYLAHMKTLISIQSIHVKYGATIWMSGPTSRSDDENGACFGSGACGRCKNSPRSTGLCTTTSTRSATSQSR